MLFLLVVLVVVVLVQPKKSTNQDQLKLILHGLAFTYRISENFLVEIIPKVINFSNRFTPTELAKIIRACDVIGITDEEIFDTLDSLILTNLQNYSDKIDDNHLFEIALTYNMTRY